MPTTEVPAASATAPPSTSSSSSSSSRTKSKSPADTSSSGDNITAAFRPSILRLPVHVQAVLSEFVWLDEGSELNELSLLWDSSGTRDGTSVREARTLVTRGLQSSLSLTEQERLQTLLSSPALVSASGLTASKLPDLVEQNPLVAIHVLLLLFTSAGTSCDVITEWLAVLVGMDMSVHSMEVVNRLTTAVELPAEFVHLYVNNCIHTCDTIKDKYMQNRLVRLVCVFLQSLIRNRIIRVSDLFLQLQAFCITFSRIREAAALFRLLKQTSANDSNASGSAAAISPPADSQSASSGAPDESPAGDTEPGNEQEDE